MDAGSSHPEGTRRARLLQLLLLSSAADDHDHDHVRVAAAAIAGVGLASSALTACAIFSFQSHQRRRRRRELQDRVKRATQQQHYDDEHEQPPRTPHPPASPTPTHTPTPAAAAAAAAAAASHAALHRHHHHHHHHLSHSQSSSSSTSASTDGGTPRYLSQLQLQAAAAALDAQRPGPAAIIPPPLMPQRLPPQRTPSSSSLRSSLTASSTLHHHQQSSSSSSSSSASSALTSATLHPSTAASPSHKHTAGSRYAQAYPESLIREQLARHYSFFSPATLHSQRTHLLNQQQQQQQQQQPLITTAPSALPDDDRLGMPAIRSAFVIVVGVGGVGSHAALALLRSGIAHLRLIDFDQVSLSSLNRHACATLADVGRSKVHVCAEKLAAIAPWAHVEPYNELFRASEAKRLLTSPRRPDFIIDAIDNIDTKVDLLAFAYTHHIRIITASGAGAKSDPSRIQIADLSATSEDPLARAVRRRLKLLGIPKLRDKLGDGHGTAPRARTVKKREKKEQQQQQQQGEEEESKERPHTPTASLAAKESPAIVAPPKKSGSIPPASPLEKFVTPLSTPFDEESEEHAGVQQDSNDPSPSPSPSGRSGVSPSPSPSPAGTRRFTHSRRASSTSSMGGGNARYQTPLMSPSELRGGGGENGEGLMLAPPPPPPMVLEEGPDQAKDAPRTEEALKASLSAVAAEAEPEAEAGEKEDGGEAEDDGEEEQQEEEQEEEGEEEGDPTTNKKAKGTPFSRTRKPHSHALTPSALLRSSLELDPLTGHRLTLPCVFSTEKSDVRLLELPEDEVGKGKIEELAALEDFRVRVLPVLGPIPAMFGLAAATYVLCEIAGWPMEPLPYLNRRKMYEKMLSDLEVCERRHPHPHAKQAPAAAAPKLPFALSDIAYLTEEVFHSRSCIPPFPTLTTSAVLMRWDSTLPLGVNNVVLLSKEEGKVHAREVLKAGRSPWEVWGRAAAEEVKRRMVAERRMQVFR